MASLSSLLKSDLEYRPPFQDQASSLLSEANCASHAITVGLMLGGFVGERWDPVLGWSKLVSAPLNDGPGLFLRVIAIIPVSILYERHDGGDRLKRDFKQCGSEIACSEANQWLGRLVS